MNWGKAIVAFLAVFVLFICSLSYYMFRTPVDDYDHHYYEDGLNFDQDYTREEQVTKDHAQPEIQVGNDTIAFAFSQIIVGQVKFMRPSSDEPDRTFNLSATNRKPIVLNTTQLAKGEWQLVLSWKSGNKNYLYQKEVYIK